MRSKVWFVRGLWLAAPVLAVVLVLGLAGHAQAGGVVGNGTPGSCTAAAYGAATATSGSVTFNCGPNPVTIVLSGTVLVDAGTYQIDGGGLVTLDADNALQQFFVLGGATLDLRHITVKNGSFGSGGAIATQANATVQIEGVTFVGNTSVGLGNDGGAILNKGLLTINGAQFITNAAADGGGAVYNDGGSVVIRNSTFDRNSAVRGGALFNAGGSMTVDSSLVVSNVVAAGGLGGGVFAIGDVAETDTVTLTNTTLTANVADTGGALFTAGTTQVALLNTTIYANYAYIAGGVWNNGSGPGPNVTSKNTIIAGSLDRVGAFPALNCDGPSFTSAGHNIIGDNSCFMGLASDQKATDPQLGALAYNNGFTKNLAPLPGSPAINQGDNTGCPAYDQRSYVRPIAAVCDVGAVEAGNELMLPLLLKQ